MNGYADNQLEDEEWRGSVALSDGLDGCYLIILIAILIGGYAWLS